MESPRTAIFRLAAAALVLLAACAHKAPVAHVSADPPGPKIEARDPPPVRREVAASVVSIIAHRVAYDWKAPWAPVRPATNYMTGAVVAGKRILVTAGSLGDHTLIEVQKFARPERFVAKLEVIDYEIPLALLSVQDPAFWQDLEPLEIAEKLPKEGSVTIHRWLTSGQLEDAKSKVRRILAADHRPARTHVLTLEVSTQIENGGWSEVLVADDKLVGLSTSHAQSRLLAIGAPVLGDFVKSAESGSYRGIARGGFAWEALTNPMLRNHLGLKSGEGGVMITKVMPHGSVAGVIKVGDVVLEEAGHKIDVQGQFEHPEYGRLASSVLFTDGVHPGDVLKMKVLRGKERVDLEVKLRRMPPEADRIPPYAFDKRPDYFVSGGLLFQDLTRNYLETFGDWSKHAPLRLRIAYERDADNPTAERPRFVVLTKVLADPANLGYQDLGPMIVESVNGTHIRNLEDVRGAFKSPERGFHVLRFLPGQGPERIVLDASEVTAAEQRVRARYGIPSEAMDNVPDQ